MTKEENDMMSWVAVANNTMTQAVLEFGKGNRDLADRLLKTALGHVNEARKSMIPASGTQRKYG